jgi:hypothetical protein
MIWYGTTPPNGKVARNTPVTAVLHHGFLLCMLGWLRTIPAHRASNLNPQGAHSVAVAAAAAPLGYLVLLS